MPALCEICGEIARYKNRGKDEVLRRCSSHKEEGMIYNGKKQCAHSRCGAVPCFNFEGQKSGIYCGKHKQLGMIDIVHKKCLVEGCATRPNFNLEGSKTGLYCSKHKNVGMVNIISKRCIFAGCTKTPAFNMNGSSTALYCDSHKLSGMINVKCRKCLAPGCIKQSSYNLKGEKIALYCATHKDIGMIDIKSRKCIAPGCTKQPTFNLEGQRKALYCGTHKLYGMVDIKSRKCRGPGCTKTPNFNLEGKKTALYCITHKSSNMVNVTSKRCAVPNCSTTANFSYLFHPPQFCAQHKQPNMFPRRLLNPLCVQGCGNPAYYCPRGLTYPARCEEHALPDDVNIVEKPCASCSLTYFIRQDQSMCNSCRGFADPTVRHSKELRIKAVFEANQIPVSAHDTVIEDGCSRYRPDFVLDCGRFILIIEVDEHQHRSYPEECEISRMIQIHQDFGGTPVIFLRYNPDNYRDSLGQLVNGFTTNTGRENTLIHTVQWFMTQSTNDEFTVPPLTVYYIYYNGSTATGISAGYNVNYTERSITEITHTILADRVRNEGFDPELDAVVDEPDGLEDEEGYDDEYIFDDEEEYDSDSDEEDYDSDEEDYDSDEEDYDSDDDEYIFDDEEEYDSDEEDYDSDKDLAAVITNLSNLTVTPRLVLNVRSPAAPVLTVRSPAAPVLNVQSTPVTTLPVTPPPVTTLPVTPLRLVVRP